MKNPRNFSLSFRAKSRNLGREAAYARSFDSLRSLRMTENRINRLWYLFLLLPLWLGIWAGTHNRVTEAPVNLRATFITPDFYERSYSLIEKNPTQSTETKGLLVNHHLLASNLIAQAFEQVKTSDSRTVVLLSPNHFEQGGYRMITTNASWATPYGKLSADRNIVAKIKDAGLVEIDNQPFIKEHGVSGLVAFIKKSLPNARVVPIIFKVSTTSAQTKQLADYLLKILPSDALILASLDMSHYVADKIADSNDDKTVAALEKLDISGVDKLEVDSRAAFSVLIETMKLQDAKFNLLARSSSTKLSGSKNPLDNTSYITGFFR
jgi:AmmeMemoRadiSam system protein B